MFNNNDFPTLKTFENPEKWLEAHLLFHLHWKVLSSLTKTLGWPMKEQLAWVLLVLDEKLGWFSHNITYLSQTQTQTEESVVHQS